jgi:aminoglycoside 6'-N-acetyltransferase
MADAAAVGLRPARRADWDLIRGWLGRPDVEAWWGPRSATEAEVAIAMASEHALCRIIEADGLPVGYAHAIDAQVWGEQLPQELEAGTWDLDLFIASEEYRGRGVGQSALAQLTKEVFSTTLAIAVCVFPSVRNERAVRAYEKAGFRWKRIWDDPLMGPSWFMLAERPKG